MRRQQEEAARRAAEAQRQALIDAQNNAAQQSMTQSNQLAAQNLMRQQEYQRAIDAARLENMSRQSGGMGQGVTGGAFNVNAMNQARMANLGTSTSYVPPVVVGKQQQQQESSPKTANVFGMPSVDGLTFGGT